MDRINAGEMPPKKQTQPKPDEVAKVAAWISSQLTEAEAARQVAIGKKSRFAGSREEYRNTIHDLLGITYDASDPAGLPADPDWQGFERIGSVLTLSPTHVEKYLAAAETVLNEALALGPQPKVETYPLDGEDLRVPGRCCAIAWRRGGCSTRCGPTSCPTTAPSMPAIWISRPPAITRYA